MLGIAAKATPGRYTAPVIPFLPEEVEVVVDSLRRALGITSPIEALELRKRYPTQPDEPGDEQERRWLARSETARITVHTYGWYPDASGFSGGEQTFTITLFGSSEEPRGEIGMSVHQFAGWHSWFKVPEPITDALRAEGITVP
ncbi:MAG: hypothetical protein QM817_14445 [Archangium sp.]